MEGRVRDIREFLGNIEGRVKNLNRQARQKSEAGGQYLVSCSEERWTEVWLTKQSAVVTESKIAAQVKLMP